MTTPQSGHSLGNPLHHPVRKHSPVSAILFSTMLLAACTTSVPLPPWSPASAQLPAPAVAGKPPQAIASPTLSSQPATAAPYGSAVSARFPEPFVVYATPGLQAGRTTYTSQTEIRSWLRDQVTAASRIAGLAASIVSIGSSQQGEALEALVLARDTGTDPVTLRANGKPTVMLVGQQHGNEPAGSEALLVLSRELAQGLLQPLLERINVVIVPRANPDGSAANLRTTHNGVDLNRDHLLLVTPEAQALARLARNYHPAVVVDAHEYTVVGRYLEKYGAVQKFDALFQYATAPNIPEFLTKAAEEWYRRPLLAALKAQGLTTEWYYTTSSDLADKKISMGGTLPDTGRNVDGLKNAVSLLIETRGVGIGRLHIQRRVHTQVTALSSVLASTAQRVAELNQLLPYVDKEVAGMACKAGGVVEAQATPAQHELVMLDPVTGADKTVTVDWDSSLLLRPVKTRVRPCGYWLAANATVAVERLQLQGVQVQRVAETGSLLADSYRETSRSTGERQDVRGAIAGDDKVVKVDVSLARGVVDVPRGSYYVPMNQPLGNLIFAALEPDTQSSYFANHIIDGLQSTARIMVTPSIKLDDMP